MRINPEPDAGSGSFWSGSHWGLAIGFAAVSYGATLAGHALHLSPDNVAVLWLTNALLMTVLMIRPYREWWRFLILSAVVQVATNFTLYPTGESWASGAGIGGMGANLLEAGVGAALMRRYLDSPSALLTLRGLFIFLLTACGIAAILGAAVGVVTTHFLYPDTPRSTMFLRWVAADAIGTALLVPPLLSWVAFSGFQMDPRRPARWLEGMALVLITISATLYIFFSPPKTAAGFLDLPYALFPFLVWAIVRFHVQVALTLCLLIGLAAATGTAYGLGPFVAHGGSVPNGAVPLQSFLTVIVVSILIVCTMRQEREQAIGQVLASEERLKAFFEHSPHQMLIKDLEGRFTLVNATLEKVFGKSRDEILGGRSSDFLARETADLIETNDRDVQAHGKTIAYEIRVDDQEHLAVRFPIFGPHHDIVAIGAISTDITDLKRAEAELRDSEERYRLALETAGSGGWDLELPSGQLHFSDRLLDLFGYERQPSRETLDFFVSLVHPDDYNTIRTALIRHLKGLTPLFECDYRMRRHDGTYRWMLVIGRVTRRNAAGRAERLTGATIDITDRKLTEDALRASEQRYRSLVEGSLQGIVILDSENRIEFANTALAHIFGYEHAHDLVGQALKDRLTPQSLARVRRYRQARLRGEAAPYHYEIQGVRQDGSLCWLETLYSPLELEGQTVRMSTVIDISERKQLEQEVMTLSEHEQRRLGQELHDGLGQLLTGIALESRMLADDLAEQNRPEATTAAQVADWVYQALGTAHDMAHGLYPEALSNQGFRQALESLAAQAERLFGLTCKVEGDIPDGLMASSEALHLYRIAQEAVTNAVKHGQATQVTLQAEATADSLCLIVRDNGVGIPDDAEPGAGMGLRNMRTRAATLDATLEIKRLSEGGTAITCTVPLDTSVRA